MLMFCPSKLRMTLLSRVKSCVPIDLYFALPFKWHSQTRCRTERPPFLDINMFDGRHILLYVEIHYK